MLRNVVFGYAPEQPALRGISFRVVPGEHVALVGRTGAGKSSVLQLVGGLYAPWSGTIRVAGRDPRVLTDEERRRVVGVAPQMVQLFSGTVWENLTLWDRSAPRDAVERAVELAGAESLIRALPQGYDTPLSGTGRSCRPGNTSSWRWRVRWWRTRGCSSWTRQPMRSIVPVMRPFWPPYVRIW